MPPRRRKTLSSPSSTLGSAPLSTTEQSLRSTPATSEADSEKSAPGRPTRSRAPTKATKKRARESSDEGDPLAMEEDEEEPLQKVANRPIKRRAITNHAYIEIPVKKKPSIPPPPPTPPNEANRSGHLMSLTRTRKAIPGTSNSIGVSSMAVTDDDQEEYLTSNSLEYQDESESESEFEQDSEGDSASISDIDSDGSKSLPPFRPALKKNKSRQSMASSKVIDQDEVEQAMLEAALEESRRTAVQERKITQSSRGAGSSRAAVPPLPDFDDDSLLDLSDDDVPLKPKGRGKGKGKGKVIADSDDSDAESEGLEQAGDFDAPELTAKERKALSQSNDPVKIHQRAMARKLGRKLTHAEKTSVALHLHHPELRTVWGDLERKPAIEAKQKAAQPPGLKVKLLPFQQESLLWMRDQEEHSEWKGGMLADEMGMGKTIQTLALLVSDHRKPNLVVAPTVAIIQWKNEIEAHTEGLKVYVFHGATRIKEVKELKSFDIVLTTYAVLESSYRKQHSGFKRKGQRVKETSPLHAIKWARIILDEAHNIKERSCNTAKGAFGLQSEFKWCLSGTPLQNRVGELYSLIRFLGGDPFAYYFCKKCDCKSLYWRFSDKKACDDCKHSPMHHVCLWNNEILGPIQKNAFSGPGEIAFKKLRILLDRVMLRRTKLERADELGLPPRTVIVRRDYFSPEEKELYLSLFTDATRQFSTYVEKGTLLNNYSNIFSLITRMRQMACHPDLVLKSKTNLHFSADVVEATVCRLCNDIAEDAIESKCHHIFDRECIKQYCEAASGSDPDCPVCHIPLSVNLEAEALELAGDSVNKARQGILGRLELDTWRSSSKIEALVEELSNLRRQDCTTKSIVFSQFVNFLDLIAYRLKKAGFNFCRLEGTMSPQARDATIKFFMNNVDVTVFLVSLKAGGVALNLTEASRVYLMDSWWNPAVEYQAMDRIHRLGQHRPVQAIKLVIEDSIESRIVQLQEKKSAMVDATLSTDESAMGRLTPEDLGFLFRL